MNNTNTSFYKRSFVVIFLEKFMVLTKQVLPKEVHGYVVDFGLSAYRSLLRILYFRHVIDSWVINDVERRAKTTKIFKVMPYSLVGASGLEATCDAVYDVEKRGLPGSLVECGVARGGSAALMSLVAAQFGNRREIWLFDSFEGLPEPTSHDFVGDRTGFHIRDLPKGSCLGKLEQVEWLLFNKMRLDRKKITLVKGWFESTLSQYMTIIGAIAVLRIDADWYESVKCCLDSFYDNVMPGGYIIIDDYGSCFGARKAVDEFLSDRKLQVQLVSDGRGGCCFVKPT